MNKVLHHSVILHCDVHRAFQMFTENELLEKWFPVQAEVEPVVDGLYELFWDPEDRENNSTIGCRVTAVEEDKLLALEWKGPMQFKDFMNFVDPLTQVSSRSGHSHLMRRSAATARPRSVKRIFSRVLVFLEGHSSVGMGSFLRQIWNGPRSRIVSETM